MQYRHFDPDRDAAPVLQSQWLQPGEQPPVVDFAGAGELQFDMPRRDNGGKLRWPTWLRVLLWIVFFPVAVILAIIDAAGGGDPSGSHRPPRVFAFGPGPHCQAAALAEREVGTTGFWVRSDRRFAYLRATPVQPTVAGDPPDPRQSVLSKAWNAAKDVGQALATDPDQLPPQPVRLTTVFEYQYGQFAPQGHVTRTLARRYQHRKSMYERVALPDGSGFDFWRRPA